jgi:hypothetical protein
MRRETAGWSLPRVELAERVWLPPSQPIIQGMRDAVGVDAVVLRYVTVAVDDPAVERLRRAIYVMEAREPTNAPRDARWIDQPDILNLPLAQPDQRALLAECLREFGHGAVPALRPGWARRGWLARAAAWIETELERAGCEAVGPIEQLKAWGISCVLRVPTASGDVYFKATPLPGDDPARLPLLFANEPALTRALAARFPAHVPTPLAIDRNEHWLLLRDFGTPLDYGAPIDDWERVLAAFAAIQVLSVPHVDGLLADGALDRRLDRLPAQLDAVRADPDALAALDPADAEPFRAAAPRLRAICAELADYGLPPALMHGDLHLGNVVAREDGSLFFDWTDGCIGHPGFDLVTIWEGVDEAFPDADAARERLRAAYLTPWMRHPPMADLLEASRLTDVLGALHLTISYAHIVANLEPEDRVEMTAGLAYFARATLRALDRFDGRR